VGAERVAVELDPSVTYLWRAEWRGGFFNASIIRDGANGATIYNFGKPYRGTYRPNPHRAYVGAPVGRGGPADATVPGMIVRQVWISSQPGRRSPTSELSVCGGVTGAPAYGP